jgi:hypothetical protein
MSNSNSNSGGMSLGGVTCLVLIILKLAGVITMAWGWVLTSFIWASILWVVIIMAIMFIIGVVGVAIASLFN